MKLYSLIIAFFTITSAIGQDNDSALLNANTIQVQQTYDAVKDSLVMAAMHNPALDIYDASVRISEHNVKKAKSTWLNSFIVTGNINEFVVSNSPISNFYPKYNFGFNMPLGAIGIRKNDVKIAKENVHINQLQKDVRLNSIRAEVLRRFEIFLEKKYQMALQSETTQEQYTLFLKAQKEYSSTKITLDKLSTASKDYNTELSEQRTFDRELKIAIIDLEEIVGMETRRILQKFNLIN